MDFTPKDIVVPLILMQCDKLPTKEGATPGFLVMYNSPYGQFGGWTSDQDSYREALKLKHESGGQGLAKCRLVSNPSVTNGKFVNFAFNLEVLELTPMEAPATRGRSS